MCALAVCDRGRQLVLNLRHLTSLHNVQGFRGVMSTYNMTVKRTFRTKLQNLLLFSTPPYSLLFASSLAIISLLIPFNRSVPVLSLIFLHQCPDHPCSSVLHNEFSLFCCCCTAASPSQLSDLCCKHCWHTCTHLQLLSVEDHVVYTAAFRFCVQ